VRSASGRSTEHVVDFGCEVLISDSLRRGLHYGELLWGERPQICTIAAVRTVNWRCRFLLLPDLNLEDVLPGFLRAAHRPETVVAHGNRHSESEAITIPAMHLHTVR
jgi:hypothetical protein